MEWEQIGKRIRKQREYLGFTREVLAEKISVTPKFCSDIELGVKGMSVQTLCRLSKVLNLSVEYILFGSEQTGKEESPIARMIQQCPADKVANLEQIVKLFLMSVQEEQQ